MTIEIEKSYIVKEVAKMFSVHPSIVYDWCQSRLLGHERFGDTGKGPIILILGKEILKFKCKCFIPVKQRRLF